MFRIAGERNFRNNICHLAPYKLRERGESGRKYGEGEGERERKPHKTKYIY